MAKIFLEDFVTSIDHMPAELRERMLDMRDKDIAFQESKASTLRRQSQYFRAERKNPKFEDAELNPPSIKADYVRALDLINQKIDLGVAAFDSIDRQCKRLEVDIRRLEQEMEEEKLREKGISAEAQAAIDKKLQKRKSGVDSSVSTPPPLSSSMSGSLSAAGDKGGTPGRKRKQTEVEETADAPIDPSEPLYCICQQVSFGEMVACDNNLCPFEWFHYSCVGLTTPPKGKWFCASCLAKRKKLIPSDK